MRRVVRTATFASAAIAVIFTLIILGVTGFDTTPDALGGLRSTLSSDIVSLALIFGIISMFTSFVGVSEAMRETFSWDLGIDKHIAWAMAVFIP